MRISPDTKRLFLSCCLVLTPGSGPSKRNAHTLPVNQRHPSANPVLQRFKTQDSTRCTRYISYPQTSQESDQSLAKSNDIQGDSHSGSKQNVIWMVPFPCSFPIYALRPSTIHRCTDSSGPALHSLAAADLLGDARQSRLDLALLEGIDVVVDWGDFLCLQLAFARLTPGEEDRRGVNSPKAILDEYSSPSSRSAWS